MVAKKHTCYNFDNQPRLRNGNHKSDFDEIPNELLTTIFARVASSSIGDLYNAKLSCKTLMSICDDSYVLKHASLEKFPVISWEQESKKIFIMSFLELCQKSGNPEALYRKGVVDYFKRESMDHAIECLELAKEFGHQEASYAIGIILILAGEKQKGTRYLGAMKKDKNRVREVKKGRKKLNGILRNMWIENKEIAKERPTCCSLKYQHMYRRKPWSLKFYEEYVECETCLCDSEISRIYNSMMGNFK
ncbi:hypothetical protein Leryth_006455 [Lithospermum erythrorhizon]|nr:hypothetical protein Leryth_006455 [Lithospermum erythrorhizon]